MCCFGSFLLLTIILIIFSPLFYKSLFFGVFIFSCYMTFKWMINRGKLIYYNIEIYDKEIDRLLNDLHENDPYGEENWEDETTLYKKYVE